MNHPRLPLLRSACIAWAVVAGAAGPLLGQAIEPLGQLGAAAHVIIPQARSFPLHPDRAGVRISVVDARVEIREQAARTTLTVGLQNGSSRQEEAVLLLPVPDGAVVSGFSFEGSAAEPTAEVLLREEARRLYDAIVARVLDPALVEFAGYNLIRSSVFPIPPGGTQQIRLTYEHVLQGDGDRVDYILPRSESLVRRHPWHIRIDLASRHSISTVYSPSHEIDAEREDANRFSIRMDAHRDLEPGPFRLSYLLDRGGVTASIFAYPDPGVGGGYFLLMAGLPARMDDAARKLRREVTIVIDRSGSMAGPKMDQVRAAALQVVEGMEDGEAFNILDYSSTVSSFAPHPVIKTREAALEARAYLQAIRPVGGTNIHDALVEALRQEPTDGMLPLVLFLTDGLPTIGRTSELAIRGVAEHGNPHRRRVFTFGVGEDVNAPLLDRIADVSRAVSTYVLPGQDVELEVARVFKRLYGPVLADAKIQTVDTSGAITTRAVTELIPHTLPDLFEGDQLILLGQYRSGDPVTFVLSGNYLGDLRQFHFTFDLASATTRNAFVPRLWASRRIAFLVDQIRQAGAVTGGRPMVVGESLLDDVRYQELIEEILRLSTEFGILTEYTAFLAREGTDLADWDELQAGCVDALDARAVRTRSGEGALNQAINYVQQKGQRSLNHRNLFMDAQLNAVEFSGVQQLCDRAFFRKGNRWIDSRLLDVHDTVTPDEIFVIGSEGHFRILRQLVEEGRQGVISLKGEILVEIGEQVILVTDGC